MLKSRTIYKGLKYNGERNTLEFKREVLFQFHSMSVLDEMAIENSINTIKKNLIYSEKMYISNAQEHKIIYNENNTITLKLKHYDSECDNKPLVKEFCIVDFKNNNICIL